jgi:hypothetical protein
MIRAVLTIITVAVLFVFTGCTGECQKKEAQAEVEMKNEALTADAAKQALLDMGVEQIPPGVHVPLPKDEPITILNPDEITIGRYHCNLKAKKFHASAFNPKAERHQDNDVWGIFERNADGKWVAKVTESSSGG